VKAYLYTTLVMGSLVYNSYIQDNTGVMLSLFVLPLCVLLFFREDK